MSAQVAVLYEDQLGVEVRDFPLHTLVCNTIADRLGVEPRDVAEQFDGIPKKSDGKLLRACVSEVPRMSYRHVIAIFDADKLHRLLKLPGSTSRAELLVELRRRCSHPSLQVLLLEENTESLVLAAAQCLEREPSDRKDPVTRDRMLASAAWAAAAIRTCIHDSMPSFAAIINALTPLFVPTR